MDWGGGEDEEREREKRYSGQWGKVGLVCRDGGGYKVDMSRRS